MEFLEEFLKNYDFDMSADDKKNVKISQEVKS